MSRSVARRSQRNKMGEQLGYHSKLTFEVQCYLEDIEVAAEEELNGLKYTGERQRNTIVIHISKHRKAHQELVKAIGLAL
jgi:hypothetical protein